MKTCSNSLHRYIVTSFSRLNAAKVCVIFVVCIAAVSGAFAQKRNITEKDLWDFVWIGDPQVSPDGSRVAFVRVTVNDKKEGYNTSIWSVNLESGRPRPESGSASQAERREGAPAPSAGEAPRQLTKGDHDSTPRWSPDGKFLAFLRSTEKDGKPEPPQLAVLPMTGGDSFVFTDLPKGAGNPAWAPDGKSIAFTSETNEEDLAKQEKKNPKGSRGHPPPLKLRRTSRPRLQQLQMSTRAMCT